uniref:Uncharacterized protein n=1 Tax=Helianthus annuus TaxID=4232 RepID=A0A251RWJ2_HELAN
MRRTSNRGILQVNELETEGVSIKNRFKRKVGFENKTKFWLDKWFDNSLLMFGVPQNYEMCKRGKIGNMELEKKKSIDYQKR